MSITHSTSIMMLFAFAFVLNLPFGYLRAGQKRRAPMWFVYIHVPIPFVILMRYVVELGLKFIPISLAASILGQYAGGMARKYIKNEKEGR